MLNVLQAKTKLYFAKKYFLVNAYILLAKTKMLCTLEIQFYLILKIKMSH